MSQPPPQTTQLGSGQPRRLPPNSQPRLQQQASQQQRTPQPQQTPQSQQTQQPQQASLQQQTPQPRSIYQRGTYHQPGMNLKTFNPPRYIGYRVFCKWAASDQTYFIVRKFPALNVRVILSLQDEIVKLEQELDELDEDWSREELPASIHHPDPDLIHNGTFRNDCVGDRKRLLAELTTKLSNYNRYVNDYAQLARQPQAPMDDITNVESWFENHPTAIDELESQYIRHHEELISVQPKIRSWFRGILEMTHFLKIPCIKPWFTRKPYDYTIIDDGRGYWQDDKKVETVSQFTIAIVGLGMLVGPLWWLNFVSAPESQLGIITGFIALFFVLVAVATTASVAEALAAAAAYSAVLMVFLQLGSGGGSGH